MLVEIRPIQKTKWHGLTGDKDFTRDKTIEAAVSRKTGEYDIRFASEEEKTSLEKSLGYDLSTRFDPDRPHPTWTSKAFWVTLPSNTFFLDTTNPMDAIKLAIAKGHPYVANSLAEYEQGLWERATHVIYSEQEEYEQKAKVINQQNDAAARAREMSKDKLIKMIRIIDGEDFQGRSDGFVAVKIKEICDERPTEFLKWATADSEDFEVRSLILQALYQNKLRKQGPSIYYGQERLGIDMEDAISFLKNPENQAFRIRIMESIG